MEMRIRNNKSASFGLRYTGINRGTLAKSLEKLSSGYAINRAGDDAAGLAISEKMRRQITGLGRADKNSREGSKLIQVGEGALDEIHSMLNRAASLANQSANGVYEDEIDREALQAELDELCDDIDRISKSANFNGVKLFQNKGPQYEEKPSSGTAASAARMAATSRASAQAVQTAPRRTLDDLLSGQDKGDLNIVYVNQTNALVNANPTGEGGSTLAQDKVVTITNPDGTTTTRQLSDILKTEIVPNTVKQVLSNYPAFSYLTGSTIGLGLEYYTKASNPQMAGALAYIGIEYPTSATMSYAKYTLGVNIDTLPSNLTRDDLVELEATISHEMIHAFMDEATTAGMIGFDPSDGTFKDAVKFPTWFVEGMAQTASGPGNWVHPNSGGGLRIDANSTDATIRSQIQSHQLGTHVGGSGDYGTGYLACMYLGWTIAGGGNTAVNANSISLGLTSLMNKVINGDSLDKAIQELTNNKFTSTDDFKTKFNAADAEVTGFVHNLMVAKGAGRGGLVSGDLTDRDLVPDSAVTGLKLFELDKDNSKVNNVYPSNYPVLSGGTVSVNNPKPPTGFAPAVTQKEYGDFIVKGNLPDDGSGGMQGIIWDQTNETLIVTTGGDIEITMKSPTSGAPQHLKLDGTGKVTLNGVTADSLQVSKSTEVSYEGKNDIGSVTVDSGKEVTFQGKGQLNVNTFTNNGAVSFDGGAVIVGGGSGTVGGTVKVNGASVAANITTPTGPDGTTALKPIAVDWNKLPSGFDVASITVDGVKAGALLDNGESGKLWLDPAKTHRVTFTDSSGVSKSLEAAFDTAAGVFKWGDAAKPFTLNSGLVEGTDYKYEDNGETLVILTDKVTSVSGGNIVDASGTQLLGRIKIKDGLGAVSLELNGVDCTNTSMAKAGLDLGSGNQVTLKLASNSVNTLKGGSTSTTAGCAGISLKSNTTLTIEGDDTAVLNAEGGYRSAGIGTDNSSAVTGASITITGGRINAVSGDWGAGIGAGCYSGSTKAQAFGNIKITGGIIKAHSKNEGAGIGGAQGSSVGDIEITGGTIDAFSTSHGAGIGGGHNAYNGNITITGGNITAVSNYHGTGIGAGCSSNAETQKSNLIIKGNAVIEKAQGGDLGAGMGASWYGNWGNVEILENAVVKSTVGGDSGAGIGSGSQGGSNVGDIVINTTGSVNAEGGKNGVGIGSGQGSGSMSSCGDITISQGTVYAKGSTDSTGIGAGRGSRSGNITIGDASNSKVIVTAEGGMTNNGGNIMSYTDASHTKAGTVTITGSNTSVRPGSEGEGLYSTSGVTDGTNDRYAYPVYLFHTNENTGKDATLASGVGLNATTGTNGKLPLDKNNVDVSSITITSDKGDSWTPGLSHSPLDHDFTFVWLKPEDQKLTISWKNKDGSSDSVDLDLIYYENAGVFRIASQDKPPDAVKPDYNVPDPKPVQPNPPSIPQPEEKPEPEGIILQIGAEYGETLTVPRFYLSLDALKMGNLDISTQPNAWESMPVIQNAINRVSSIRATYGALYNRLEHNQNQLRHMVENTTDAESRIRDTDMAEEMMVYTKANILNQSAQAMLAQAAKEPESVLQLLG